MILPPPSLIPFLTKFMKSDTQKRKSRAIEQIYPLTPLQQGMLFHSLESVNEGQYIEQFACTLVGDFQEQSFVSAWETLVARHAILRTGFVWKGQREPVQVVMKKVTVPFESCDWEGHTLPVQEQLWKDLLAEDRSRGFELRRAPLMRLIFVFLGGGKWKFLWTHHHLLLDGWSLPILLREFLQLLDASRKKQACSLPSARPFSDYISWLRQHDLDLAENFWRNQLADMTEPSHITDVMMTPGEGAATDVRGSRLDLSVDETKQVSQYAQSIGITLNSLVQAAWAVVLSRYSNRCDVVFGVTLSGRPTDLVGVEEMVGLFINTLPLRVNTAGDQRIGEWLREVSDRQLQITEFGHSPLGKVRAWSELGSGVSLFDHLLVFENYPTGEDLGRELDGLRFCEIEFYEHTNYPLTLIGVPGEELSLRATWMPNAFTEDCIDRLLMHWKQMLGSIARSRPDLTISQLQMLTRDEQFQYFDWAQTAQVPQLETAEFEFVHEGVCAQAAANPNAIALSAYGAHLSYRELDRRSATLANRLVQSGVSPGDHVGVLVTRDFDLIVSMLAVLRAGAVYVPVDAESPGDRVKFMLEDAGVCCCLVSSSLSKPDISGVSDCFWLDPGVTDMENLPAPEVALSPDDAAYMIYTSGSTGEPKGCRISHRNLSRLFTRTEHWFSFSAADVWTMYHSAAFDFSVWEIWGALFYGGRLVIVSHETCRDPREFAGILLEEGVTVLNQTPSAFLQLVEIDAQSPLDLGALRTIIFGGEALDPESLLPWIARHGDTSPELINMYGITETTVHVTYQRMTKDIIGAGQGSVIGEPIPDLSIYLLDCHGNPAPVGIDAEIYVAGAGVSLGYWNRDSLTGQRFPRNPFGEGRLYRTGDLARRRANGALEFRGRLDHQVKIRGFRIELGEIEHTLCQHPDIREAVVLPRTNPANGDLWLVAWFVGGSGLSDDELRSFLELSLPTYMIPAVFILMDGFQLTLNGKRNLSALPEPSPGGGTRAVSFIAPRDELESGLAAVWQEVLSCGDIGVNDNYYSLGGDSIRSIRICSEAAERGITFGIRDLLENPTVAGLAEVIRGASSEAPAVETEKKPLEGRFVLIAADDRAKLPGDVEDAWPLAHLQSGMVFHQSYEEGSAASVYHDIFSFVIEGQWDEPSFRIALGEVMSRHPVLRSSIDFAEYSVPLQLVHAFCEPPLEVHDLSGINVALAEEKIAGWFASEKRRTFQIECAPLFRVSIHRLNPDRFQLSVCFHHAILDGWSFGSLLRELFQRWKSDSVPEPTEPLSYMRFIALEQEALDSEESAAFWEQTLADAEFATLPRLGAVADSALPRTGRELVGFRGSTSDQLKVIAGEWGVPLKHLLLAIHLRVLATFCMQDDLVVGLVSNGRPDEPGGDETLGLFLNTLPFRCQLSSDWTWSQLVGAVNTRDRELFPHRRFPMAEIQSRLGGEPLFETDFNFVHFHVLEKALEDQRFKFVGGDSHEETNFTLTADFSVSPTDGVITGSLSFDRTILDPGTVRALAGAWRRVAESLCEDPSAKIGAVGLAELKAVPSSAQAGIPFEPVHKGFSRHAQSHPGNTCIRFREETLSFVEVERRANQLAHYISGNGVAPGQTVGICMHRCPDMVVSLLAVAKAGACWVLIDPDYPVDRVLYMIKDSGLQLMLSEQGLLPASVPQAVAMVFVDSDSGAIADMGETDPDVEVLPHHRAYLVYTSGSTGRPKCIVVSQHALSNHMQWMLGEFDFGSGDRVLQKTPCSFDAAIWEFWAPLLSRAELVLAEPGGHLDADYLLKTIEGANITIFQAVPTLLEALVNFPSPADTSSLRYLFSGGEALKGHLLDRLLQRFSSAQIVNLYGPAEVTIDATSWVCDAGDSKQETPIGRPIDNVEASVLDQFFQPTPEFCPGELHLGGRSLADGYHQRPSLTAECFVPNPFSSDAGSRLYKTGDIVYRNESDVLRFIGRADSQVKIGGQRIELGEIEKTLESHPAIDSAIVLPKILPERPGEQRLVAWYTTMVDGPRPGEKLLRDHLKRVLPSIFIPSSLVHLEAIPTTPNGKLDERSLPIPQSSSKTTKQNRSVAMNGEAEVALARIWESVLNCGRVGAEDNFFDLGGDSILSLQIIARYRQQGWTLSPRDLFEHQTVGRAAARASLAGPNAVAKRASAEMGTQVPLAPIQANFFELLAGAGDEVLSHWNQSVLLEIASDISAELVERALEAVLSHHEVFRFVFRKDENGVWTQSFDTGAKLPKLQRVDLSSIPDDGQAECLTKFTAAAQRSLSIERQRLFQPLWFQLSGGIGVRNRIFFACHHLITDGVSWRIFLEDFSSAIDQLQNRQQVELVPVTESALTWAESLRAFATAGKFDDHKPYWDETRLAVNSQNDSGLEQETISVSGAISKQATQWLLHESPGHLRSRLNDWLLAALAEAWYSTTSEEVLLVHLEGHGREDFGAGVDVSRTMGWFTALYPVCLKSGASEDPVERLKRTKETLRAVPDGGVSYAALEFSNGQKPPAARCPSVSFNYLGQLDQPVSGNGVVYPASESTGADRCPEAPRQHELDFVLRVTDGRLHVECLFPESGRGRTRAPALLRHFTESLEKLVSHFEHLPKGGATPSDFPLVAFAPGELERVMQLVPQAENFLPLTPLQEGLFIHSQIQQQGGEYLQQVTAKLKGEIKRAALMDAWGVLIERHELLRSSIVYENLERPLLAVHHSASASFKWLDWRELDLPGQERQWQALLVSDRQAGFDLTAPPLMRFTFARTRDDEYRLLWTHHHLILDGWSLPVLVREFFELFEHPTTHLPPARPWKEHLEWLSRQDADEARGFWKQYLNGFETPTDIERDSPAVEGTVFANKAALILPHDFSSRITGFCKAERCTLNTLVQGAWGILLGMHNRSNDVVFGVTVSGRPAELDSVEERVGLYINTLPLRLDTSPGKTIGDYLSGVQSQQGSISRFEYSKIAEIRAQASIPANRPLFETLLVFENYPLDESTAPGAATVRFSNLETIEQNHFPLSIYVTPGEEIRFEFAFRSGEFSDKRIHQLMNDFQHLLTAMIQDAGRRLGDIDCFRPGRLSQINGLEAQSGYVTLPEQFAVTAAKFPQKTAVTDGSSSLNYQALDEQSSRLADELARGGIKPGSCVGVHLSRKPQMLVVLLGIMKAGAAYVPLDPEFPEKRLSMMVEDSDLACIISAREISSLLPASTVDKILLLEDLEHSFDNDQAPVPAWKAPTFENLAYVLFTSGSTGRPKGVAIPHRALGNFLNSWRQVPGIAAGDTLLAVTTLSFDISALELFLPLTTGATVHIASTQETHDPDRLAMLADHATVLQATPATWKLLTMSGWRPPNKLRIWCGGEAFPRDLAELLLSSGSEVWNVYGPTETTIWSLIHPVRQAGDVRFIGKAIDRTSAYVVDSALRPVPTGCIGELLIGGDGLAYGYVGQPAQSAELFVPNAFSDTPGARLYRTGDLVRQHESGVFEFFGRVDQQVKVRGFRVELAEVEECLRGLDLVRDAAVHTIKAASGEALLAAYVVAANDDTELKDQVIREQLRKDLPDYMIPSQFVRLDSLPLTPNGKIDRKALSTLERGSAGVRERVAPTTAVEKTIARIWQTVLKVDAVGIDDPFLELGGHSLSVAQAAVRLRRIFKIDLGLEQLFSADTVRLLAQLVEEQLPGKAERIAAVFLKVDGMSPEEKAKLLNKHKTKTKSGSAETGLPDQ